MDIGHHADAARFLIRDRAGQFTESFDAVFTAAGIRIRLSPPQAPKAKQWASHCTSSGRWSGFCSGSGGDGSGGGGQSRLAGMA